MWGGWRLFTYVEHEEPAFPGISRLRPQIWRVTHAEDAVPGTCEWPARVCRVLQADGAGERGLAEVTGAQRGLVHLSQLRALGIGRGSYNHRLATGSLHRVLPSVLSVVHPVHEPWAAETAALLYAGDNAVLSHETAAAVWGLAAIPFLVAITLIGRKVEPQPLLRQHRVKALDIRDVTIHAGFPVTSPARTLIDCAARRGIDDLLNEARVQRLVTNDALHAAMARCSGRAGTARVRARLAREQGPVFDRSRAERILRRIVEQGGLPRPQFNTYVLGFEVDAYWPDIGVIVEVDGYDPHGHWTAFQNDRRRDQTLTAAGYTVVRVTWHQLTRETLGVAVRIAQTLARRAPS